MEITEIGTDYHVPVQTVRSEQDMPQETAAVAAGQEAAASDRAITANPAPPGEARATEDTPAALLADLLKTYGLKPGPENIKMLEILIDNRFPLDKETVTKFNQALKLLGSDQVDRALFLLMNNMRPTMKNAAQLNQFLEGGIKITEQIACLMESLETIENPELRGKITDILLRSAGDTGEQTNVSTHLPNSYDIQERTNIPKNAEPIRHDPDSPDVPPVPDSLDEASIQKTLHTFLEETAAPASFLKDIFPENENLPEGKPVGALAATWRDALPPGVTAEDIEILRKEIISVLKDGNITPEHLIKIINETVKSKSSDTMLQAQIKELLKQRAGKLLFSLEKSGPKDIDRFLNTLRDNLNEARSVLLQQGESGEAIAKVIRNIDNIREHIEFTTHLKNNLFVQLPLNIHDSPNNAELFIFRDSKKGRKGTAGIASALIALDTESLGRFEAYVQKNERRVNCQFRLANNHIESLVRSNLARLEVLLAEYGYTLEVISFKQLTESFTLLSREPLETDELQHLDGQKRIAFDIRM